MMEMIQNTKRYDGLCPSADYIIEKYLSWFLTSVLSIIIKGECFTVVYFTHSYRFFLHNHHIYEYCLDTYNNLNLAYSS